MRLVLSNFFSGGLVALLEALSFTPAPKPMVADAGLVALPETVTPTPMVAVAGPVLVALPEAGAPMPMVAVAVLVALPAAGAGTGSGTGATTGSGAGTGAGTAAVALDAVELDESPGDSSSLESPGLFEHDDRMKGSDRERIIMNFISFHFKAAPKPVKVYGFSRNGEALDAAQ